MPFFIKNNMKFYYETHGDQGPWLTLLNGHTRTTKDFKFVCKNLEPFFRILTFDQRGAGQTKKDESHETPDPFTWHDMAEDVKNLWNHLKIVKSHLLGISMGGMIAQAVAQKYNTQVDKLILVSTANHFIKKLQNDNEWPNSLEGLEEKIAKNFSSKFKSNPLLIKAMAKSIFKEIHQGHFLANAALQRKAILNFVNEDPIRQPCLIIHGSKDEVIPLDEAIKLSKQARAAETYFLEVGHLVLAEAGKEFTEKVKYFLIDPATIA